MTVVTRLRYGIIIGLLVLAFGGCLAIGANASSEEKAAQYKYYATITVQQGDTLESIADIYRDGHYLNRRQYMSEVVKVNCLSSADLYEGMTLKVPYYSSEYH